MPALELVPMTRDDAGVFIAAHHRHHGRPAGHCFAIGAARDGRVVGVAMVGRPVARALQDGWTAEVTRLCVLDAQRNACSFLYGACWRAARAIGYRRLITYTLPSEGGGKPPRRWLDADRRGRRRIVVAARAAARRQAPDAGQTPMGACRVIAPLVWQVIWIGAGGEGLGACGHRHNSPDEATLCPFEPADLPDVCAGLVRQVRDPEYRTEGQRLIAEREARRPRQLELELGDG